MNVKLVRRVPPIPLFMFFVGAHFTHTLFRLIQRGILTFRRVPDITLQAWSQYYGVTWDIKKLMWKAQLKKKGTTIHIGYTATEKKAAALVRDYLNKCKR